MPLYIYYDSRAVIPGWVIASKYGVSDEIRHRCKDLALVQGVPFYTDDVPGAIEYITQEMCNPYQRIFVQTLAGTVARLTLES